MKAVQFGPFALTLGLALLAAWLGVPAGARGRGRLARLRAGPDLGDLNSGWHRSRRSPRTGRITTVGVVLAAWVSSGIWLGTQAVLLVIAASGVTGTVALLLSRRSRRVRSTDNAAAVSRACAVLAGQVRIGQVPSVALSAAAEDCPVLRPALNTINLGGDPVSCWQAQARTRGLDGLADLARAWQLSAAVGTELAPALEAVADGLGKDRALQLVITAETSAPRATGRIMALLPLVGIGLGYMMGGDPLAFLLHTGAGRACFAVGALCACAGVLWMERAADRGAVDR